MSQVTYKVRVVYPVPRGPGRPNATLRSKVVEVVADNTWFGYGQAIAKAYDQVMEGREGEGYTASVEPLPTGGLE